MLNLAQGLNRLSNSHQNNGAAVGSPSREYIYSGGALLAKIDASGTKYYHQDHLSNRLVTSSTGATLEQLGHYPYGESWYNSTGDKLTFTTYERDPESGNDFAMARSYINRLGRFSSPDPLAGSVGDPQSLNRYAYTENNPILFVDPSGMDLTESCDDYVSCGGGGGGGASGPSPAGQCGLWCWLTGIFGGIGGGDGGGGNGSDGSAPTLSAFDLCELYGAGCPGNNGLSTSAATDVRGGGDAGLVMSALKGAAAQLAKSKLDKEKCLYDLIALGVTADQVRAGAQAANFLNGIGSSAPYSSLFLSSQIPASRERAAYVTGTIGQALNTPGYVALAQLSGTTIYFNPTRIDPTDFWNNVGLVFHEVIHNITGLLDRNIQDKLTLSTKAPSSNISDKLLHDCF